MKTMETKEVLTLIFLGTDGWDRPVYIDSDGTLWKNVMLQEKQIKGLCSVTNNDFDGEPLEPIQTEKKIVFAD